MCVQMTLNNYAVSVVLPEAVWGFGGLKTKLYPDEEPLLIILGFVGGTVRRRT